MAEKLTYVPVLGAEVQAPFLNGESGKRADLHLHTSYSDGSVSPEEMVELGLLAGMNAIAITDHDIIESSDRAMNYVSRNRLPIEVVRGMEVSSRDGHVLALDIEGFIPQGLPLTETIKMVHRQGGLAIILHPGTKRISSVSLPLLNDIINSSDQELYLDGVEVFNASAEMMQRIDAPGLIFGSSGKNIRKFIEANRQNHRLGALLANSDAHTGNIGYGITVYNEESVLDAIRNRNTVPLRAGLSTKQNLSEAARMTYAILRSHLL